MTAPTDDDGPLALSAKQRSSIAEATARVNLWHGSVSSGKTIASIIAWLDFIARDAPPRGELLMIGVTLQSLERNVLNVIAEMAPGIIQHTTGASTARIFGRTVHTIGANDARAERRIRGVTAAGAYVDEASLMPGDGYWSQLLNRLRVEGARLFASTNPDSPNHWLKKVIDQADELGYRVWHFTLEDNPSLTDDYVASIKRENHGLWYKRNIAGLWVLAEGQIWDAFDPDRHVVDHVPVTVRDDVIGIDHGITNAFAALVVGVGVDPADGVERLWVRAEWRHESKTSQRRMADSQYSKALKLWVRALGIGDLTPSDATVLIDPAAAGFRQQMYLDGWERAGKANNTVEKGLAVVSSLFAADRVRIHRSCAGLLGEIGGYVWDPKAVELGKDAPLKVNDHSCDGFRYAVMGQWEHWERWLSTSTLATAT